MTTVPTGEALWKVGNPYPSDWVEVPMAWLALNNPRRGDIPRIAESIQETGFFGRLLIQQWSERQRGPRVIAGNHRYRAGISLGMERFPVTVLDCTDDEGDRVLVADNRHSDLAIWNDQSLVELLQSVSTLDGTGFTENDLDVLLASLNGPNEPEPTPLSRPQPTGVRVQVGTISFVVDRDEYDSWETRLTVECGTRIEDQIAEIRAQLQL